MTSLVLIGALIIFMILGLPVSFAMGLAALVAIFYDGSIPFSALIHRTVMGVDSFVLLAIPLFILAGTIMEQGGISERLIHLARTLVGRFRGGLPMGVVGGTILESGISGSTVADVSAMASMTLKPLERAGYERPYSLSVICASAALGILVPPCILMVVVGAVANVSVIALFAAGVLPALLLGAMIIGLIYWQANRHNMPRDRAYSKREIWEALKDVRVAMGLSIVIFGGIIFGVATVTEIAAFAVLYAFIAGTLIYKKLTWRMMVHSLVQTGISTGVVTIILGLALVFGFILANDGVPAAIANWITAAQIPPWGVLVITALIFIFIGSVLDGPASVLIFIPILAPVVREMGIDMVHWLTVVVLTSGIGLFIPPAGMAVIMACSIGKIKMEQIFKPLLPFMLVLFAGVLLLILFPSITTIMPQWLGLRY